MNATYSGGWVFGERASMTLGAFKFDDWRRRWEGNLHFPAGTCRVYLEVNPKAGIVKDARRYLSKPCRAVSLSAC